MEAYEIDGDRVKRESERSICSSSDLEREREDYLRRSESRRLRCHPQASLPAHASEAITGGGAFFLYLSPDI
jgi:hypothetical protein